MLDKDEISSELSLEDFTIIRDFIHEKCGIFFAENKKYLLENRLFKRMSTLGLKSFRDYFYQVKYDTSLKEFNMLMNLVTTNETSFYRNPPQLLCFQDEVLPQILESKRRAGKKRLRIWSAGCSTGEEPYTISMIIMDVLGDNHGWNVEIVANDISENVLQAARKAQYSEMALRTTPPEIVKKYFRREEQKYAVIENVKRQVNFSHLNLADRRRMALMSEVDFVFCRNVMIYFSDEIKQQIVRGFYNSLLPGGYMFIGHAESLHGISKAFKLEYFKNGLVYHKEIGAAMSDNDPTPMPVAETRIPVAAAVAAPAQVVSASAQRSADTHAATMEKLKKIQDLLAGSRKRNS